MTKAERGKIVDAITGLKEALSSIVAGEPSAIDLEARIDALEWVLQIAK